MKRDKTLILSGTAILIVFLIMYTIFQLNQTQTISVTGQSEVEVVPDLITINYNIETNAEIAAEAKDANSEIYNKLVLLLTEQGFKESGIKTSNYNIYPDYDWSNGKKTENGYTAQHSVKLELSTEESAKITGVIDAGVEAGALINYINFELSEALQKTKKAEATQKATEDAKIKAESIAEGLGQELGKIVSVSDAGFNYSPRGLYTKSEATIDVNEAGALAQEAVAEINPSEQIVYGSISVVYKVK